MAHTYLKGTYGLTRRTCRVYGPNALMPDTSFALPVLYSLAPAMLRKKPTPGLAVLGLRIRSQLYLKSEACTSRLTGAWNMTPLRSVKVQTRPSELTFGKDAAMEGTSCSVPCL